MRIVLSTLVVCQAMFLLSAPALSQTSQASDLERRREAELIRLGIIPKESRILTAENYNDVISWRIKARINYKLEKDAPKRTVVIVIQQLPTGEIISVDVKEPSSSEIWDKAVQAAAWASSPLPVVSGVKPPRTIELTASSIELVGPGKHNDRPLPNTTAFICPDESSARRCEECKEDTRARYKFFVNPEQKLVELRIARDGKEFTQKFHSCDINSDSDWSCISHSILIGNDGKNYRKKLSEWKTDKKIVVGITTDESPELQRFGLSKVVTNYYCVR